MEALSNICPNFYWLLPELIVWIPRCGTSTLTLLVEAPLLNFTCYLQCWCWESWVPRTLQSSKLRGRCWSSELFSNVDLHHQTACPMFTFQFMLLQLHISKHPQLRSLEQFWLPSLKVVSWFRYARYQIIRRKLSPRTSVSQGSNSCKVKQLILTFPLLFNFLYQV